jgi:hypothetical protein
MGMSGDASPVERLRRYLREISPEARTLLLRELERGALSGAQLPGFDLVLDELRAEQRTSGRASERLDAPDRRFFLPIEPFLVDEEIPERLPGRIVRASLPRIWTWLQRDLMAAETEAFVREATAALTAGDAPKADRLVHDFQTRALAAVDRALAAVAEDRKARQKLASQLGGEPVLEAAAEIAAIFRIRGPLQELAARLPGPIKSLAGAELEMVRTLFEQPAIRQPGIFAYALIVLLSRLSAPVDILRLAVTSAETDSAKRIAETPFAFALDLIVDETSRAAVRLARDMRANAIADVCVGIKRFHDLARGFAGEINGADDQRWTKRLAQLRAETSALLRARIDGLPGQVRRLLRPHPKEQIAPGAVVDRHEISDVEGSLEILRACRMYAAEVAVSEITLRLFSELESCLDAATEALLDSVRNAAPEDRPFRLSQLDAAVRFASKVFGRRYAELLAKAAEVAGQSERRTAQG